VILLLQLLQRSCPIVLRVVAWLKEDPETCRTVPILDLCRAAAALLVVIIKHPDMS
jgi:hypothetical protein